MKRKRLRDPPKTVEPQKRYFGTKDFSPDNVSYEVLALIYLLRWVISPFGDKSGNPYTKEPVKFGLKVVAKAVGKPHEGYDYLEALDGLEDI